MKIFAAALAIFSLFPQAVNAAGIRTKKLAPCPAVDDEDPTPAVVEEKEENPLHKVEFEYSFDLPFDHDVTFSPAEQKHIFEAFQYSFNDLNDPEDIHMDDLPTLTSEIHKIIHKHPLRHHVGGRKLQKRLHLFEEDSEGLNLLEQKIALVTTQRIASDLFYRLLHRPKAIGHGGLLLGLRPINTQLRIDIRPTIPDNQVRGRGSGNDGDDTGERRALLSPEENHHLANFIKFWERAFCARLGESTSSSSIFESVFNCKIDIVHVN